MSFQTNPSEASPPVFGCIIPSRPIHTNPIHLPPNRFLFHFQQPDAINHLVVFLTGIVPLPDNYAASIHYQFPNKPDWQLLGMLSPAKPSAIFRLKGAMVPSQSEWTTGQTSMVSQAATATLGILVAPIEEIITECSELNQALALRARPIQSKPPSLLELAKAIGLNLFRYLSSFSATSFNNETWIPISVLEKWWKQFEVKLSNSSNPEQWLLDSSAAG